MGEEGDAKCHVGGGKDQVRGHGPQVTALRDPPPPRQQSRQHRQQGWHEHGGQDEPGPQPGWERGQRPGRQECHQGRWRRERSTQVVDHLPARDGGDLARPARRAMRPAQDPGQELPVASCPAVLACHGVLVARGRLVEELDVGDQARSGEGALQQVVAQQRVLGCAIGQRLLEGIDVVDPLAGVGALTEEVLVDVGDRGRVGVDARGARVDTLVDGCLVLGRQGRGDPRLQDGVSVHDPSRVRVEHRAVQRVCHRAHETCGGTPWQSGVGIEGDDVANAARGHGGGSPREQDGGVRRATQQGVELVELAALALPPHPDALGCVPTAFAVEEQETGPAPGGLAVAGIQPIDGRGRCGQEGLVTGDTFVRGVQPIGQQGEAQVAFGVREMLDLQEAHLRLDVRLVGEERRDHDERAEVGWHTAGQLEPRKRSRADEMRHQPVGQGHRDVRRGDEGQDRHGQQGQIGHATRCCQPEGEREDEGGDGRHRAEVAHRRLAHQAASQALGPRHAARERLLERGPSVGDQVAAHVKASACRGRVAVVRAPGGRARRCG